MWRKLFAGVLLLLVAVAGLLWFGAGGKPTPVRVAGSGVSAAASELPGVACERRVIPVKLSPGGWFNFDVVGELCRPPAPGGRVLQVLVSGSGYDHLYWDFPYQPDHYSYARAALRAGYTVFNFDRLGVGASDHPLGLLLTVDNQAHVLSQVVAALTAEQDYAGVVALGHSFGSVTSIAFALAHPEQVDGIVLTGYAHNTNPEFTMAMRTGVDFAAFKGPFAGRLFDPTYVISKAGTRGDTFYTQSNADPLVIETDEMNRQPTALGEAITASKYFGPQTKNLQAPTFLLLGEDDFVVCGGALDCHDHAAAIAHERPLFGPDACLDMAVVDDTNHDANLHRDAPRNFAMMLDWIARRVGAGDGAPAAAPCGRARS